jgi:hypothetical protein
MSKRPPREGFPVQVWLDEATYERLQALADSNGRPIQSEGLHAILRHLASPPTLATPPLADVPAPPVKKRGRKPKGKDNAG